MTRTLTPLRGESKCGHGKSSENTHEFHDEGDLMNELRVCWRKDGKAKMAIERFWFAYL
jgi:hypothetical protein